MSKPKNNALKAKPQEPNNQLFGGLILLFLVLGSMYLAFNSKGAGNSTPQAAASNAADETTGWYLYQTKRSKFFEVKYPHHWTFIYGGGVKDEEYLRVKSADSKISLRVLARSNKTYANLESFVKAADAANPRHILKEEKLIAAGQPSLRREEYVIQQQAYSITTYIFDKDIVVEFSTDFPDTRLITSSARALHQTLLSTFRFLDAE